MSHRHLLCKQQYNCGDTDHSHRHLLCKRQYICGATDHSHRHLLCRHQYNCGDTDHSHRHLLCKHQYNCGDTDHSHRHLLCKHQYNCDDTDHSQRHLLCRHQYNCGDTDHSHRHLLCRHQHNCGDKQTTWHAFWTTPDALATVESLTAVTQAVADGCDRKRKTWRTQPHPQTPKWNGNPCYAFGKKGEDVFWPTKNVWKKKTEKKWRSSRILLKALGLFCFVSCLLEFRLCGCQDLLEPWHAAPLLVIHSLVAHPKTNGFWADYVIFHVSV